MALTGTFTIAVMALEGTYARNAGGTSVAIHRGYLINIHNNTNTAISKATVHGTRNVIDRDFGNIIAQTVSLLLLLLL